MATQEQVLLEILARTDQAIASVERLNGAITNSGKNTEAVNKKSSMSFIEFAAKIGIAYQSIKKFVDASIIQSKADAQLNLAIKNNTTEITRQGKSVTTLTNEYKKYASAREAATNIDDAATQQLQKMVLQAGEAPERINRVVEAMQDMEAGSGIAAESIARAWARMAEDPTEALGALSRAGVKLNKEMLAGLSVDEQKVFILGEIEKKYKGQAVAIAEAEGGIGKFNIALDNMIESMGNIIVETLAPIMSFISQIIGAFNEAPKFLQGAIIAVGGLTTAVMALNGAISLGPIGWFLAAGSAIVGLVALANASGDWKAEIDKLNSSIENANDSLSKIYENDKNNDKLLRSLEKLQKGTTDYERTIQKLIDANDELKKSGVTVKSSYEDIKRALKDLDSASLIARQNRLADIAAQASSAYSSATSQLNATNSRGIPVQLNDQLRAQLEATQQGAFNSMAEALLMQSGRTLPSANALGGPTAHSVLYNLLAERTGMDYRQITHMYPTDLLQSFIDQRRSGPTFARNDIPGSTSSISNTGSTQEKKAAYDLYALRISQIEDEFERRRQETIKSYFEEKQKIEESSLDDIDKAEGLALVDGKLSKELSKIKSEEQKKLLDDLGNGMASAFNIGTSIVNKDWKSAIGSTISAISPAFGSAFSSAVSFFSMIFEVESQSMSEILADKIKNAFDVKSEIQKWSSLIDEVFGESLQSSIDTKLDGLKASLEEMGKVFKYSNFELGQRAVTGEVFQNIDFSKWTSEQIVNLRKALKSGMTNNEFKEFTSSFMNAKEADAFWDAYKANANDTLSALGEVLQIMNDIKDVKIADAINEYRDNLEEVQHLEKIGQLSAEDSATQQVAIYGQMIDALDGVANADKLIKQLKEEQYALMQKQTGELEKQGMTASQNALISRLEQIDLEVKTGARRDDYATAVARQGIYSQLLGDIAGSQGTGSAAYSKYAAEMGGMVSGYLGAGGFGALSGSGAAVTLPSYAQPSMAGGASMYTNNTTNATSNISLNANLPPDIVQYIMGVVSRQTGGRNIIGSYA